MSHCLPHEVVRRVKPERPDGSGVSQMPAVKIGALCWNQYTTWPDLLAAGRRADRLGYDTLVDVGSPLPDRRQRRRSDVRRLADARGVGSGDRADPHWTPGRSKHVPRARLDGEDGDDPRSHLRRPSHPRHRCGVVRDRARRLRLRVRERVSRAAALAWRGASDHAWHAPWRPTDRCRASLSLGGSPQRSAADPGSGSHC